ncbi:MAG: hypothetical protein SGI77_25485 [Pirellulaceae bacterium]|nr:hypothetical protein [Pirellulaceae bacterium]
MADLESDPANRVRLLAQSFPSLWNAPGIRPWDALTLDAWASSGTASHGELCTARFILAVWDSDGEWRCGKFDVMNALRVWDDIHRQAFINWATDPWWA